MRDIVRGSILGAILVVAGMGVAAMAQNGAGGQVPPDVDHLYASAADVQALLAKAKEVKPSQPTVAERILRLTATSSPNAYSANLEYRSSVGPAAVHLHEAEIFYVIDGSCTMTTGGKLTEAKPTNAENLTGTGIEGGTSRPLAKGDFMIVPENTPHWVSAINGSVVFMTLHVPRPAGSVATSSAEKP